MCLTIVFEVKDFSEHRPSFVKHDSSLLLKAKNTLSTNLCDHKQDIFPV